MIQNQMQVAESLKSGNTVDQYGAMQILIFPKEKNKLKQLHF